MAVDQTTMLLLPTAYIPAPSSPGRLQAADRLIFQHFPKTAGTTVHDCLSGLFEPSEICPERVGRFAFWPRQTLEQYRFFSAHATGRQLSYIPGPTKLFTFLRDPIERCISLYEYWRLSAFGEDDQEQPLEVRFARAHSAREFFAITGFEQRRPFWNVYTAGLAGDALISPSGKFWASDSELLDQALARMEQLAFVGISEDLAGSMDALCRQLDVPNLYAGQVHNKTRRHDLLAPASREQEDAIAIDDDCLDLIRQANGLDAIVYERAVTLALGDRRRIRLIGCVPALMPACHVRSSYSSDWVENRAGGYILFGPYARLLPGRYVATFRLRARPGEMAGWTGALLGHLDVCSRLGTLLLPQSELTGSFESDNERTEELTFEVNHALRDVEFRVFAVPGAPFDVETTVSLRHV